MGLGLGFGLRFGFRFRVWLGFGFGFGFGFRLEHLDLAVKLALQRRLVARRLAAHARAPL